jgi:NADPH-dependent 2,4-dienoyl-CoA reductase/sulfur reductase-like enzyme
MQSVVIVGASLAGTRTAQALRMKGFEGRITLIGAEDQLPYDRPPLSKEHLAVSSAGAPELLVHQEKLTDLELDLRLGVTVAGLDIRGNEVELHTGERVGYDWVVLATGSRAREWQLAGELLGVHVLRTIADADGLRESFRARPRVAVLGGGFIGSEVAAAARKRDLDVTIIELLSAPMSHVLGPQAGDMLGRLHTDHGVRLCCGTTVAKVRGSGRVEQLLLTDGSVINADIVIVGLGAIPATEWLANSGLDIADGVRCDETLRAAGTSNVFAAGDIASWPHPLFGRIRLEHWTNAQEHAAIVAGAIVGDSQSADSVPYVWSDQYERRIQLVGRPAMSHDVTIAADHDTGSVAAIYEAAGRVRAVLTIDAPRSMLRGRRAITSGHSASELLRALNLAHGADPRRA